MIFRPPSADADLSLFRRAPRGRISLRWLAMLMGLAAVVVALVTVGLGVGREQEAPDRPVDLTAAKYVGRETCAKCHAKENHAWLGSHHHLAMDLATDETVLADFDDASFTYQGVTSKMFRRDGKFFINTEGPDGQVADFEVKYVIGVEPLQQYMVEFDDGRVQVLRETWDTEGKRWYYHYPPDVRDERLATDDPLHWTNEMSNWNYMCADCHTTELKKNFDIAENRYHTSFAEMNVSCETCHGPGSIHVELAEVESPTWDGPLGYGLPRLKGKYSKNEIETCARCHMRRAQQVADDFRPGGDLGDYFAAALLREPLYHADGQINDEVYVYGSFIQSKMHARGIRCSDCHDPHSTKLKHEGNQVCTSCHQHPAQKYDTPEHHHHKMGSTGAQCVECHMPEKHYMVVDPRRDHSFRVPRPDLSLALRTPNACTDCHLEMELEKEGGDPQRPYYADWLAEAQRDPGPARERIERLDRWSLDHIEKWYGERKEVQPHFAHALTAARAGKPEAESLLFDVLRRPNEPPIVRATALFELGRTSQIAAQRAGSESLNDKSPLVRATALAVLGGVIVDDRNLNRDSTPVNLAAPLLADPVRLVRIEAARVVAPYLRFLTDEERQRFNAAAKELEASFLASGDRSGAHRELASLHEYQGQIPSADAAIDNALRLAQTPAESSAIRYRHAMMMIARKKYDAAEEQLRAALKDDPRNRDAMSALIIFYIQPERLEIDKALEIAKAWHEQFPDDPDLPMMLRYIDGARRQAPPR